MKALFTRAGFLVIGLMSALSGAAQDFHVQRYTTHQGLSEQSITDVHRDRFGYLWVATSHGLNQYNGLEFKVFRYDPEDSFSIRANSLERLYEGPDGNIWVSLSVGGVNVYDRYTGSFHYFTANPANGSDPNNFVKTVMVDSKQRTWVGTSTHINLVDPDSDRYEPMQVEGEKELYVFRLYEDSEGNIWAGTSKGLFRFDSFKGTFAEVLSSDGKVLKEVFEFVTDRNGQLWAGSYSQVYQIIGDEARLIERPSGRFISNLFIAGDQEVYISQHEDKVYRWNGNGWVVQEGFELLDKGLRFAYAQNGMNQIMVTDNEGRFYLYDLEGANFQHLMTLTQRATSFWFGEGANELWIGSPEAGLFKIDLEPKSGSHHYLVPADNVASRFSENYISEVYPLDEDQSLVVSGGKLLLFSHSNQTAQPLRVKGTRALERTLVDAIRPFHENKALVLTRAGVFELDWNNKRLTKLDFLQEMHAFDAATTQDSLWTIGDYGLAVTRLKTGQTLFFKDLDYVASTLKQENLRTLLHDDEGNLWIGTVREGLFRLKFNRQTGRFESENFQYSGNRKGPFKTHTVNVLKEDSQGRLWVGNFSSGLLEFDRDSNVFINHNPAGQLPIAFVHAIEEAVDGALWISSKDGIHRYMPETGTYHQLTAEDGVSPHPFVLQSSARLGNDVLAFGTENGLTLFDPNKFSEAQPYYKVLLEQFSIENDGTVLHYPEGELSQRLKYDQNFVAFDFIALDFQDPKRTTYQYRLEGLEEDWNTIKQRHVQYANLAPGHYTFQVRAGMEGGNWNEELTEFSFYIHKPFWWQTWFIVLMILFIALTVLVINRIRMNMKLARVRALETVRQNAAADFHDEMGNKLTRISLFTEVLEKKLNGTSPEIRSYVEKIKDNSHVLNNSMRDFLWALDPEKDTAFDLIVMLKDFGDELFDNSDIHFHVASIKEGFREYPLDMDWKRHLVMIFKEAMHNALKYSEARKVTLKATLSKDVLNLSLADDGQGFDMDKHHNGYGLANMKRRAEQLGAAISIESKRGKGTVITFIGTLTKNYETYD